MCIFFFLLVRECAVLPQLIRERQQRGSGCRDADRDDSGNTLPDQSLPVPLPQTHGVGSSYETPEDGKVYVGARRRGTREGNSLLDIFMSLN